MVGLSTSVGPSAPGPQVWGGNEGFSQTWSCSSLGRGPVGAGEPVAGRKQGKEARRGDLALGSPSFPWRRKQQAAVGKPGFVGKEGGTVKQRTQQNVKVPEPEDQKGGELHEQAFVTYPAKSAQGPSSPLDKKKKEIMTL